VDLLVSFGCGTWLLTDDAFGQCQFIRKVSLAQCLMVLLVGFLVVAWTTNGGL